MPIYNPPSTIDLSITGNTAGATSLVSSGTGVLVGGNNITLSQAGQNITISGPNVPTATNFSLNGSSSSVSLVAGNNITLNSGVSSITIVGPSVVNFSTISLSASGNTTSSSSGTYNNVLAFSGQGIASVGVGAGSVTINVPAPAASGILYVSATSAAGGATAGTVTSAAIASTLSLVAGNNITLSQGSNAAITFSVPTPAASGILYVSATSVAGGGTAGTVTSAAINSTLSLVAGTNITLSQGSNDAITIIGAASPAYGTQTISASGTSITGTAISLALVAGNNISLQTVTAAGAMSISISGENAVSATGFASSTGTITFAAGAGLAISTGAGSILYSTTGSAVTGFAISSSTAGGVTQGTTTAASGLIQLVAGNNITLSSSAGAITVVGGAGAAAGTQTISAAGTSVTGTAISLAIAAGNNVTLSTATAAGSMTITIGDLPSKISFWQNNPLGNAGQPVITYSGAITSNFLSSMFLQRISIGAAMTLTEVDLAMGITFPGTASAGAGTLSQSFQLFSFPAGNTTSLGNVLSASGSYTWLTGNTTVAGSASISQFQGGWSVPLIHPMTFASTSIPAGEYVAAHLLNFGQGSSTWTVALYGAANSLTNSTTYSAVTSISTATVTGISLTQTSAYSRVEIGTTFTVSTSLTAFSAGPTSIQVVSTVGNTTASLVPQYLVPPNFVFQGTGSSSLYVGVPSAFIAGAFSTGSTAASIALANITYTGTYGAAVPYMALVGS